MMAETIPETLSFVRAVFLRELIIEWVGLFWLSAEVLILLAVVAVSDYISREERPALVSWRVVWSHPVVLFSIGVLTVAFLSQLRYFWWPPLFIHLGTQESTGLPLDEEGLSILFLTRRHQHQGVWALFVAGWVLFECLIVCQGWKGYVRLRQLFRGGGVAS
jgi:hypothetical protein